MVNGPNDWTGEVGNSWYIVNQIGEGTRVAI